MPQSLLIFITICTLTSCKAIQVIIAADHKPEIQTPQTIRDYAKKHGFGAYPILSFRISILSSEADIMLNFNMYNKEGKYLSLDDQISGCPDKKKDFDAMRYLREHPDDHYAGRVSS